MAAKLGEKLKAAGFPPVWAVEGNLVFTILPKEANERLRAAGAMFYGLQGRTLPGSSKPQPGAVLARMVTSFATTDAEVEQFATLASGK